MAQPSFLVRDVGEDPVPDDGFKNGKEDEDGEVIEMFQAERGVGNDNAGFKLI